VSDNYQAVYDAVRSRFSHFDGSGIQNIISQQFDISWHMELIKQEFVNSAYEMARPSILFKPTLTKDGNQWCALYGKDLMEGVAGFGDTPDEAMREFDKSWGKK